MCGLLKCDLAKAGTACSLHEALWRQSTVGVGQRGVTFLSNTQGERLRRLQERGQHDQVTCSSSGGNPRRQPCPSPFAYSWLVHLLLCYFSRCLWVWDLLSSNRMPSPAPGVALDNSPVPSTWGLSWGESFSPEGVKCKARQGVAGILNGWATEPYPWVPGHMCPGGSRLLRGSKVLCKV